MRRSLLRQFAARKAAYPFKLSLLGVPEQVNIPIQLCQEQGIFSKFGVEVEYTTVPEGTGAMLKKLHHNEADLAITVTDGFIAGQASGYNVQLVGTYVDSPLTWAVSAHPASPYHSVEELFQNQDKINVGISRLQSGSHTMSYYMADLLKEKLQHSDESCQRQNKQLHFKELGSFSNLRKGITDNDVDIFLWEVFTTKPFFDSGELKYIGEVSTPWPAFSIVASNSGHFLSGEDSRATDMFRNRFLPALAEGAAFFKANTLPPPSAPPAGMAAAALRDALLSRDVLYDSNAVCDDSVSLIVKRFGHKQVDAQRWLANTQYALPDMSVNAERMRRALLTLQKVGLVPEEYPARLLWGGSDPGAVTTAAKALCNDAISFRQLPSSVIFNTATSDSRPEADRDLSALMRCALML